MNEDPNALQSLESTKILHVPQGNPLEMEENYACSAGQSVGKDVAILWKGGEDKR